MTAQEGRSTALILVLPATLSGVLVCIVTKHVGVSYICRRETLDISLIGYSASGNATSKILKVFQARHREILIISLVDQLILIVSSATT